MELYNGTVSGVVTVGAGASLALTGDAIAVTTLTLADGAVATVDNAAKANVGTIHAVAGVVGETATTYYTTWAAALAAAGTDFAYAYAANTAVGEAATVTISAVGADYAYEKSATFTIAASTPENPLVVTVPVAAPDTLAKQLEDAGDDASVRTRQGESFYRRGAESKATLPLRVSAIKNAKRRRGRLGHSLSPFTENLSPNRCRPTRRKVFHGRGREH